MVDVIYFEDVKNPYKDQERALFWFNKYVRYIYEGYAEKAARRLATEEIKQYAKALLNDIEK